MKDLIVIGGGPGGYTSAIRAAQLGMDVTLIEKNKIGGTCLNWGCIPTKALYMNAKILDTMSSLSDYGIKISQITKDFSVMQKRKNNIVSTLASGIERVINSYKIEVLHEKASVFPSKIDSEPHLVTAGDKKLYAKNIIIATGSVPVLPPVQGFNLPGVMTSDQILAVEKIPDSLTIIGGGFIGIEFASIFNALGSNVSVVEIMPHILPNMDEDISKRISPSLKKRGIKIHTDTTVEKITKETDNLNLSCLGKNQDELILNSQYVLLSAGRKPDISSLNIDEAGIAYDKNGIKKNQYCQTSINGIYAVGDICGGHMLAHVATEEGIVAVENIAGFKNTLNYTAVPSCVFAMPELASVGYKEETLKQENIEYLSSKFMYGANGKALAMGEVEGFVKVLAKKSSKEVLGVHIMGANASELIHEASLAITNNLTVDDIIKTIHAHPTISETFHEAFMGIENKSIHSSKKR